MDYRKPVTELIQQRYSCRTYQHLSLETSTRHRLEAYLATQDTGPLGGRTRFHLVAAMLEDQQTLHSLGTYGFIKDAAGFVIGAVDQSARNLEDYGYLFEKIILFATDLGLGTCWLGGSFTRSSFARKISLRQDECMPSVCSIGYIAEKPRLIETTLRRHIKAKKRMPWEMLFFTEQWGNPLTPEMSGNYAEALETVRLAPSASNRQPWRILMQEGKFHFYLHRTPGYRHNPVTKLLHIEDLQRVDMGIAMCHFALTCTELGLQGKWEERDPAIPQIDQKMEYTISWVST